MGTHTKAAWHTDHAVAAGEFASGHTHSKEHIMGAVDKAKNKAEELAGKAKEKLGHATGDKDTEAEGRKDQAKGNIKQAGEKVKDTFKD
ncbi:CsbD family protein [Tomitella biformata]|uniref:CsbD family protein n=1 Tax=Tomitella biformata TaxID=630403 RepID=UPI0035576FED